VGTVTGQGKPSSGAFSVAAPLIPQATNEGLHYGKYVVVPWGGPAKTVTGASRVGSRAQAVADVRIKGFRGAYGVLAQNEPACTVTGNGRLAAGPFSWAAPAPRPSGVREEPLCELGVELRLGCHPRAGAYGVLPWSEASKVITGAARIDNGPF